MAIQDIDNRDYRGKKPNFVRDSFDTISQMKSWPETDIDEGHISVCQEDGYHYEFKSGNQSDPLTGKWRRFPQVEDNLSSDSSDASLSAKMGNSLQTRISEVESAQQQKGEELKELIDAKVIEAGGVSFDTEPTQSSTNPVTSGGLFTNNQNRDSNTGISEYGQFSSGTSYSAGTIVFYQNLLYKFTQEHPAGDWTPGHVERTSFKKEMESKLAELSSDLSTKTENKDSIESKGELAIADDNGNVLAEFIDGHIRTKNFDSKELIKDSDSTSDLDITDENGNVIASLFDGHVTTKNFDSRKSLVAKDSDSNSDIDFVDENGNVIASLFDGHIRTKNFDSSTVKSNIRLKDKTISIIADSISTYSGCLPSDEEGYDGETYATYYPRYGIDSPTKTWWYKMLELTGLTLLRLCAWSGSQCCGNSTSSTSASAGCSDRRIEDLAKNGMTPDITLTYIGINDFGLGKRLVGDWDGGDLPQDSSNVSVFSEAYALMVSKIMKKYPKTRVFCCTLLDTAQSGYDQLEPNIYPTKNTNGETVKQYNDAIVNVANALGADVIDLHACGINFFNLSTYTGDLLHPNAQGAQFIGYKSAIDIINKY